LSTGETAIARDVTNTPMNHCIPVDTTREETRPDLDISALSVVSARIGASDKVPHARPRQFTIEVTVDL
jgi:hypothetical protein